MLEQLTYDGPAEIVQKLEKVGLALLLPAVGGYRIAAGLWDLSANN
jgi:hypothetical protein